jgi:hypothetical protein
MDILYQEDWFIRKSIENQVYLALIIDLMVDGVSNIRRGTFHFFDMILLVVYIDYLVSYICLIQNH